jgi:hypothetical protein
MLQVTEAPHSGTPQGYVAFVENLANGDQVTASFWGWDITASGSPSLRIWGHWALSGDVNSYVASASGNPDYTDGSGWSQLAWTWTLDTTAYPAADALVIEARLYSTPSSGDYSTDYWIDDLQVTAPDTAVVSFPEPTAIELASFTATPQASAILLQWETATELDNLGFNLYRANMPDGLRTQLNASLIPAQNPGSPVGATYTFLDEGVQPGLTYHYWLEDVDVYGVGTLHGPVAAIAPGQPHLLRPRPAIVPWSPPPKE